MDIRKINTTAIAFRHLVLDATQTSGSSVSTWRRASDYNLLFDVIGVIELWTFRVGTTSCLPRQVELAYTLVTCTSPLFLFCDYAAYTSTLSHHCRITVRNQRWA